MVSREKRIANSQFSRFEKQKSKDIFGEARKDRTVDKTSCHACNGAHAIRRCQKFAKKGPTEGWRIAERVQICYRCLSVRHYGNKCPNSLPCGVNGCQKLHHRLLHQTSMTSASGRLEHTELKCVDLTDRTTQ